MRASKGSPQQNEHEQEVAAHNEFVATAADWPFGGLSGLEG